MDHKIMPDTPWHIGYAKKKENDPRRHKSRCIHYDNGICTFGKLKCYGSAHCTHYGERDLVKYKYATYGLEHNDKIYASKEIRDFCRNRERRERWKYIKDIPICPICNNQLSYYPPLRFSAKCCNKCKILFVDEDVYFTYTEEINKSLADFLLCLVGIAAPTPKVNRPQVHPDSISKVNITNSTNKRNKKILKEEKISPYTKSANKSKEFDNNNFKNSKKEVSKGATLGDDPRFKEIWDMFKT